jgi:hypothetical protein
MRSDENRAVPMRSPVVNSRFAPIIAVLAASSLVALAAAPAASAATLYACVNKRTGAARVFTRKPSCRKHETRVSWNTQGPAGKTGVPGKNGTTGKTGPSGKNGTNGTDGSNGAANGYYASATEFAEFTGKTEFTVLGEAVPAGSYIVSAKTVVSSSAKLSTRAASVCELLVGGVVADTAGWDAGLVEESAKWVGEATLSLDAAVTVKARTTLSLVCSDLSPDASPNTNEQKVGAAFSQMVAGQTTQNS